MILLDPRARLVIGHRGNRAHAPENTLASLREAAALGVDAVEFDLRVSRDGVLVVMHDATLDRTTDDSGPVAARTAAELGRIDAGARFTADGGRTFPWRGRGACISTFDEVSDRTRADRDSSAWDCQARHRRGLRSRGDSTADRRRLCPRRQHV
jgi:glycerophosphoryl diester phosphodiesterase